MTRTRITMPNLNLLALMFILCSLVPSTSAKGPAQPNPLPTAIDLLDPRYALLDATFYIGIPAVPTKINLTSPTTVETVLQVQQLLQGARIDLSMLVTKFLGNLPTISSYIQLERYASCYFVTFLRAETPTFLSDLGLPQWLINTLSRVSMISACASSPTIRVVLTLDKFSQSVFSIEKGWVMLAVSASEISVSSRFSLVVKARTQTITAVVKGVYTVPDTFEATGIVNEGTLSIRALSAEAGVTLPSDLPTPLAAIADTSVTLLKFAYSNGQPYFAIIAESPSAIDLWNFKLEAATIGLVWSCQSGSNLLELDGVYLGGPKFDLKQPNRLRRMRKDMKRQEIARQLSPYERYTRSSFLQAAAQANSKATCMSFAIQTGFTVSGFTIPLALYSNGKGFTLTLAGDTGVSSVVPEMIPTARKISVSIEDLWYNALSGSKWPDVIKEPIVWFHEKTKFLDTIVTIERLNVQVLGTNIALQFRASTVWKDSDASFAIFAGPPDVALTQPSAFALVVSTNMDVAAALQSLLGLKVPYFKSDYLVIGVSSQNLDLNGAHSHLQYLTEDRPLPLVQGLSLSTSIRLNPNSDNTVFNQLAKMFPGALQLQAAVGKDQISIRATLPTIYLSPRLYLMNLYFDVSTKFVPPTIGVSIGASLYVLADRPLFFSASFGVQASAGVPMVSVALSMAGYWYNAFGIDGVILGNVGGSLTLAVTVPPVPVAFTLNGVVIIKSVLIGQVAAGMDIRDPSKDYLYGQMNTINLLRLAKAVLGVDVNVAVPSILADMFTWPGFILAYATRPTPVQLPGIDIIQPGFYFKGQIPVTIFRVNVEARMSLPPQPLFLNASFSLPPIKNRFIVVSRSATDTAQGPYGHALIDSANIRSLSVELQGYVSLFDVIKGGVALLLKPPAETFFSKVKNEFFLFYAFFIVDVGGFTLRVSVDAALNPTKPLDQSGITVVVQVSNLNRLQELIAGAMRSAAASLRAASKQLEAAAANLGKECDPAKMCKINCPTIMLETATGTRSKGEVALVRRAELLHQRLRALLVTIRMKQEEHTQALKDLVELEKTGHGKQPLIQTSQLQLRELYQMWEEGFLNLIDEQDEIIRAIHAYHDLKSLPEKERLEADERFAKTHNEAVDSIPRFAESELVSTMTMEQMIEELRVSWPEWLDNIGSAIKDTFVDAWDSFKNIVSRGVNKLKEQFNKVMKEGLCAGATRLCVGACQAASDSVGALGSLTDLASKGIDKIADLASFFVIDTFKASITVDTQISCSVSGQYRVGSTGPRTFDFTLSTPPFDAKGLDASKVASAIWENIKNTVVRFG